MSKAFTKESDDLPAREIPPPPSSRLPPGVKNYLTPDGAQRLREELQRLSEVERPRLVGAGQNPEAQWQLAALDQRLRHIRQSLETAVVVAPPDRPEGQIRFGAVVQVRDRYGEIASYRIVGVDEIDLDKGWVSFLSPIAKALQGRSVGDRAQLKLPAGQEELEILRAEYPSFEKHAAS